MTAGKTGHEKGPEYWARFKRLLNEQNTWPSEYLFKFIVPAERLDDIRSVFGQVELEIKESRRGRYCSVTARMLIHSPEEIIAVYEQAGEIPGVIAL